LRDTMGYPAIAKYIFTWGKSHPHMDNERRPAGNHALLSAREEIEGRSDCP